MKKNIALLSLLTVFSFVSMSFGQDEIDFGRTTPVISTTGGHGSRDPLKLIIWKAVYVNQKTVIIKFMKAVDCANLINITAFDESDELIPINKIDKTQFKKLNTLTKESIVMEFKKPIDENTKIKFKLDWDLRGCNGSNISQENHSASTIAPASKTMAPLPNYNSEDYFYFEAKKQKSKVKDLKTKDLPN